MAKLSTAMPEHYRRPKSRAIASLPAVDNDELERGRFFKTLVRVCLMIYMSITATLYVFAYDWRWIFYEITKAFFIAHLIIALGAFLHNEGFIVVAINFAFRAIRIVRKAYQHTSSFLIVHVPIQLNRISTTCRDNIPDWVTKVWQSRLVFCIRFLLKLAWKPEGSDVDTVNAYTSSWLYWIRGPDKVAEATVHPSPMVQKTPGYYRDSILDVISTRDNGLCEQRSSPLRLALESLDQLLARPLPEILKSRSISSRFELEHSENLIALSPSSDVDDVTTLDENDDPISDLSNIIDKLSESSLRSALSKLASKAQDRRTNHCVHQNFKDAFDSEP